MGWSKDPGPNYLAGRLPAVFYCRGIMKELSIFVDESGDFGEYEKHAPYYIITMIMHDQSVDISNEIWKLNEALKNIGYGNEQAIHTEPLIRRENPYRYFQSFSKVILYYDNGQHELNRILNTVFATQLVDYDVRKVIPNEYRLFQAADLICTLELLRVKTEHQELSNSEKRIFHSKRELKKDFLKGIKKKEFV